MDQLHTLRLDDTDVDVLACALLQAIDDLEARAVIAEHHDPVVGPASAVEYCSDGRRLRAVLDAIAPGSRAPRADRVAVRWIDGTWTISNGRPVRLHRQDDLEQLLESSLDLVHHGTLDPHKALMAIHDLVVDDLASLGTATRATDRELEHDSADDLQVRTTPEPHLVCLPTPHAAHRLAPRCDPAPAHGTETGLDRC